MRQRSKLAVSLLTSLSGLAGMAALVGLPGCEDGPSQTFQVAPANAGNLWNSAGPDGGVVTDASSNFDAMFGSVTALEHCTADRQRLIWASMLQQPIVPPYGYAGLNLAYNTAYDGITLKEAEAVNCTGNPIGGGGVGWGDNDEVLFFYNSSNYIVNEVILSLGYTGKMTFHQAVGVKDSSGNCPIVSRFENSPTPDPDPTHCTGHTYQVELGQPILKDGAVYEIDWSDTGANTVMNEIYNGLMATYGQGAGAIGWTPNTDYDQTDCSADGSCIINGPADANGNNGFCALSYAALSGFQFDTNCTTDVQPTISTPIVILQGYFIFEPYSYLASVAQINAQGASSQPRFSQPVDPQNCFVQIGQNWKDYIRDCVDLPAPQGTAIDTAILDAGLVNETGTNPTVNQVNESKAIASSTHDNETWNFNVVGPQIGWVDNTVQQSPTAIVQDILANGQPDLPSTSDPIQATVNYWVANDFDRGVPINDTQGSSYTGRGSSYIYREWAQLVQADLNRILAAAFPTNVIASGPNAGNTIYNHVIGDPACFTLTAAEANAAGCTGFEGIILQAQSPTSSDPSPAYGDPTDDCTTSAAPICANYAAYYAGGFYGFGFPGYGASVMHAGEFLSIFCQNPPGINAGTDPNNGNCNINTAWSGALAQVQLVVGNGDLGKLPDEINDIRYYYKWYGYALLKYLKAYGNNPNALAADVAAQTLDLESVFFDSFNSAAGFLDNFEYVERNFMVNQATAYQNGTTSIPVPSGCTGDDSETASCNTPAGIVVVPATVNSYPSDFSLQANLLEGDVFGLTWYKFLYRPERALFTAMLDDKTKLPGQENNVNITNMAGSTLLQQNYASYECATQYPTVSIPSTTGGAPITGSWDDVCGSACVVGPSSGVSCPTPPLQPVNPANPTAPRVMQYDLNGSNPGLGLGGTTPRLAAYRGVWGPGNACPSGSTPNYQLNPTATLNPYNPNGCSVSTFVLPIPTGIGTVFSVGKKPGGAKTGVNRLSFVGADGTHLTAGTNPNTLTAFLNVPNLANPYNAYQALGAAVPSIQVTVPWSPAYDGFGFPIPINATQDKFYVTQQLDFNGTLSSYALDVVNWTDPITQVPDGTLTVEAIEAGDFLGEAFLCQDVGAFPTPGTGDLLGAHMYDSAASILDWITAHPGSEDTCQIIVRYSIFDNYVDYITSLSAGVQVDINQGNGYGRVVGAIAFDPTLSSAP